MITLRCPACLLVWFEAKENARAFGARHRLALRCPRCGAEADPEEDQATRVRA